MQIVEVIPGNYVYIYYSGSNCKCIHNFWVSPISAKMGSSYIAHIVEYQGLLKHTSITSLYLKQPVYGIISCIIKFYDPRWIKYIFILNENPTECDVTAGRGQQMFLSYINTVFIWNNLHNLFMFWLIQPVRYWIMFADGLNLHMYIFPHNGNFSWMLIQSTQNQSWHKKVGIRYGYGNLNPHLIPINPLSRQN